MNFNDFQRLEPDEKKKILRNVRKTIVKEWQGARPEDLKKLSTLIDLENIKVETEEGRFEIQEAPSKVGDPEASRLVHEF
ncbi:MAG: hypothetical protein ACOCZX_06000, partial [Candidatus Bipolaricaulota bacterium]